jgi:hypothetical protein
MLFFVTIVILRSGLLVAIFIAKVNPATPEPITNISVVRFILLFFTNVINLIFIASLFLLNHHFISNFLSWYQRVQLYLFFCKFVVFSEDIKYIFRQHRY